MFLTGEILCAGIALRCTHLTLTFFLSVPDTGNLKCVFMAVLIQQPVIEQRVNMGLPVYGLRGTILYSLKVVELLQCCSTLDA